MKTLIPVIFASLLLGCGDGYNHAKVRQCVVEEFKSTEVCEVPGARFQFIVRLPNGEIWYAETMGNDAKVTAKTILFPVK